MSSFCLQLVTVPKRTIPCFPRPSVHLPRQERTLGPSKCPCVHRIEKRDDAQRQCPKIPVATYLHSAMNSLRSFFCTSVLASMSRWSTCDSRVLREKGSAKNIRRFHHQQGHLEREPGMDLKKVGVGQRAGGGAAEEGKGNSCRRKTNPHPCSTHSLEESSSRMSDSWSMNLESLSGRRYCEKKPSTSFSSALSRFTMASVTCQGSSRSVREGQE